jgi:hypothetical protein
VQSELETAPVKQTIPFSSRTAHPICAKVRRTRSKREN